MGSFLAPPVGGGAADIAGDGCAAYDARMFGIGAPIIGVPIIGIGTAAAERPATAGAPIVDRRATQNK